MKARLHVVVVGAGWAGLAAAIQACEDGHRVTLLEAAQHPGGRARSLRHGREWLDNGQHILIGAYAQTLALMRRVGADPDRLLHRQALRLSDPQGRGLKLPPGPAIPAFLRGVLAWREVPWRERLGLLAVAAGWGLQGFRCDPKATVDDLCRSLGAEVRRQLIEPLSVAALNTPSDQASAQVLLTVLRDALFGPKGSSDLLLPKVTLDALFPHPALAWLQARGAQVFCGHRAQTLAAQGGGWRVDDHSADAVILAASARESARLVAPHHAKWAALAGGFDYQPIVTIWLDVPGTRWPEPMLVFRADDHSPAQFGFDLSQLGGPAGRYTLVVSGAAAWVARGLDHTAQAARAQLARAFQGRNGWTEARITVHATRAEKRATFACVPGLLRPEAAILPGLWAAGDHVQGPYPATLEAAVRSGLAAASALGRFKLPAA